MYIDTHTHIYLPEFKHDIGSTIFRAKQSGVKKILLPNIDTGTIKKLLEFTASYPSVLHPMMGLHPGSVDDNYIKNLEITEKYLNEYSFIGVGEIGLDYYWDKTFIKEQKDAFITQCKWASEKKLPVSIHSRSSTTEALELIKKMSAPPHGIFHCFSGNISEAKEVIIARGEMVSIMGPSGSGKSTLAKLFNGILLPSGGKIYIDRLDTADDELIWEIRKRAGMIFQNPDNQLVATMVEDDVAFGLEIRGVAKGKRCKIANSILEKFGLQGFNKSYPYELSG